ncbi:MAG: alpha/beta fold hydrolase [Pseudomonadota bacterium]
MKVKVLDHTSRNRLVTWLACAGLTTGCALTPAARFEATAGAQGLRADTVTGDGFEHRVYSRRAPGSDRVHVYFGSDGSPFLQRTRIAPDPTPRRALTLTLMARDPHALALLGRPCYHGLRANCTPELWTVGRYSETVVASMTAATERLLAAYPDATVVLVGYSGGGTLALLVAERLAAVDAVVTVAANLDTAAWTRRHGYTPLAQSLDPVAVAGNRPGLRHRHFTGSDDDNVPPSLHRRLRERLPEGAFTTVPGYDHRCCWVERWPERLERALREMP